MTFPLGSLRGDGAESSASRDSSAGHAPHWREQAVLLARGNGTDMYRSSHEMALGAATDLSVGVFVDEGGNDEYTVGQLSMGVGHANSTGLFVDGAGDDRYTVMSPACRALGAAHQPAWGDARETLSNLGLFMDLGGLDSYPAHCARAANNARWSGPRVWPLLGLASEAGAGTDGEWPLPFPLRLLTRPAGPATTR